MSDVDIALAPEDTPEKGTGLTPRQKDAVQLSWSKLAVDFKKHGEELFIRMFNQFPAIKEFFKQFEGLKEKDIRSSLKLRAHVVNFKTSLGTFIDNLDDPECLVILIEKVAKNHLRRDIRADQFTNAFSVFMVLIEDVQSPDEFTLASWKATLDAVQGVIAKHMIELDALASTN